MSESRIVNSEESKAEMHQLIDDNYDVHQYMIYEFICGKDRTKLQNNLINRLYRCIGTQRFCGFEEARAEAKLIIGMPILNRDNIEFRRIYNEHIKPVDHAMKLKIIEVMQIPVTSLMTVKQAREYLNNIFLKYGEDGVVFEESDYGLKDVINKFKDKKTSDT